MASKVRRRCWLPSACITNSSPAPFIPETKAMRFPSGDHTGEPSGNLVGGEALLVGAVFLHQVDFGRTVPFRDEGDGVAVGAKAGEWLLRASSVKATTSASAVQPPS